MTDTAPCPTFEEFYAALWGDAREPFPWQRRLALLAATGDWPRAVAAPTGCGKTTCVEIAIWALATQAERHNTERTAPTRMWWVVNRRALVDDTYKHAHRIATLLDNPAAPAAISRVAQRLRSLAGDEPDRHPPPTLEVLQLRAGHAKNRPRNMAAPAIICSTVPMFGSRLLFRGHGIGRYTWSVDAALAGVDTLLIVDEAHISGPLVSLIEQIRQLPAPEETLVPQSRQRPQIVSVSATTHGHAAEETLTLNAADRADPAIAQRLNATKTLTTIKARKPLPAAVTAQIASSRGTFTKAIVFLNTPKAARATAETLRNSVDDTDVIVATGQMRGFEAATTAETISNLIGTHAQDPERPVIVVATQTLEVGADLDADLLITQSCSATALIQRLGRLNRLGRIAAARAVVIDPGKAERTDRLYPDTPSVVERLEETASETGPIQAGPEQIRDILADLLDPPDATEQSPALSRPLLHEWTKTTNPPPGEAPVEAFYGGFRRPESTVQVIWRAHIPEPGDPLWPPLTADETVEIPPGAARTLHETHTEKVVALASDARTVETVTADHIRPGATLIAHTTVGCLNADGHWEPNSTEPVADVSVLTWGFAITRPALAAILGDLTPACERTLEALASENQDDITADQAATTLAAEIAAREPPPAYERIPQWQDTTSRLAATATKNLHDETPVVARPRRGAPRILLAPPVPVIDAGDGLSFLHHPSTLSELDPHCADTARRAVTAAQTLGLPERVTQILHLAAKFHDLGKADPRFQRWLAADWQPGDTLLAKSHMPRWQRGLARRRAGYPRGGRHEATSQRIAAAWTKHANNDLTAHETDLLQHLIAAHHGRARPLLTGVADNSSPNNELETRAENTTVTVATSLNDTDWEQPARFARLNRRYDPWGLAALETLLRQADWQSSQAADVR